MSNDRTLTSNEHVERVIAAARREIAGKRIMVGSPLHLLEMFIKIVDKQREIPAPPSNVKRYDTDRDGDEYETETGPFVHWEDYERLQNERAQDQQRLFHLEGALIERDSHETNDGPTPHHVRYDRSGWLCSVCGGWNDTDVVCQHPHTQKAFSATEE